MLALYWRPESDRPWPMLGVTSATTGHPKLQDPKGLDATKLEAMEIRHFNDLLAAARQQPDAQRVLMVFAAASLPPDATAEQRARFAAGESGELTPLMCVDKDPADLNDFAALQAEALSMGQDWALVFAAAMSGQGIQAPTSTQVEAALTRMVGAVKSGNLINMIAFDRQGEAVQLD
jgi:hypothetical protein